MDTRRMPKVFHQKEILLGAGTLLTAVWLTDKPFFHVLIDPVQLVVFAQ